MGFESKLIPARRTKVVFVLNHQAIVTFHTFIQKQRQKPFMRFCMCALENIMIQIREVMNESCGIFSRERMNNRS